MQASKRWAIGCIAAFVVAVVVGIVVWQVWPKSSTDSTESNIQLVKLLLKTSQGSVYEYYINRGKELLTSSMVDEYVYGITGFDYCPNKTLYYSTTQPNSLIKSTSRLYPNLGLKLWTKTALASDYVTGKIYVVDSQLGEVYVTDLEGKYYGTVLSGLDRPKSVVLDTKMGFMFVLQASTILQVNMDGTNPKKVIGHPSLNALTIDQPNEVIYFATSYGVESYGYGENFVSVVLKFETNIHSLAVMKNQLFLVYSEKTGNKRILTSCRLENSICKELTPHHLNLPVQEIRRYDLGAVPKENPCEKGNGGCQHLCVLTNATSKFTCRCSTGWQLNADLKTCAKVEDYLLYLHNGLVKAETLDVNQTSLNHAIQTVEFDDSALSIKKVIRFDARPNLLVYTDDLSINFLHLDNSTSSKIETSSYCTYIPAIDWFAGNLYYIRNCWSENHVVVRSIDGSTSEADQRVIAKLDSAGESILVDPTRRLIFYTLKKPSATLLYSMNMDGTDAKELLKIDSDCLTIDYSSNSIYWISTSGTTIYHANLDGRPVKKFDVLEVQVVAPRTIATTEDLLYVGNPTNVWVFDKSTLKILGIIVKNFSDANSVVQGAKVVGKTAQPAPKDHPCTVGSCGRYCVATGSEFKCYCNDNEELQADKKSCVRRAGV